MENETEDEELFRRALADTEPLRKKRKRRTSTKAVKPPLPPAATRKKTAPGVKETLGIARKPDLGTTAHNELELGKTAGIDRRTADRFRRGRMEIEAHLDLHGLYQDEAHEALHGFITGSAAAGKRCVVVITGKGRISQGGGVLRRQVPRWLNEPTLRDHVLSIAQARIEHGGDGAIYVLLKRRRG